MQRSRKFRRRRSTRERNLSPVEIIARSLTRTPPIDPYLFRECQEAFDRSVTATIDQYISRKPEPPLSASTRNGTRSSFSSAESNSGNLAASPSEELRQSHDVDAKFWDIWLEHEPFLKRYCQRLLTKRPDEADDVLGQAMMKACEKFDRTTIENPRAWLCRYVYNCVMDTYRANALQDRWQAEVSRNLYRKEEHLAPLNELENLEAILHIESALQSLPENLRLPLLLRSMDISYDDIALALNVTNSTARKRIQLARDKLRALH